MRREKSPRLPALCLRVTSGATVGSESNHPSARRLLVAASVQRDCVDVVVKFRGMRFPNSPDFFNDRVFHHCAPISSSGVQIIGEEYPARSQANAIDERISALAMWLQFQVMRYSTPCTEHSAI
jgi:hypothetical protein